MRLMNGGLPAALAQAYPMTKWDETRFKAVPRMIFMLFCCCLFVVCCLFFVFFSCLQIFLFSHS